MPVPLPIDQRFAISMVILFGSRTGLARRHQTRPDQTRPRHSSSPQAPSTGVASLRPQHQAPKTRLPRTASTFASLEPSSIKLPLHHLKTICHSSVHPSIDSFTPQGIFSIFVLFRIPPHQPQPPPAFDSVSIAIHQATSCVKPTIPFPSSQCPNLKNGGSCNSICPQGLQEEDCQCYPACRVPSSQYWFWCC